MKFLKTYKELKMSDADFGLTVEDNEGQRFRINCNRNGSGLVIECEKGKAVIESKVPWEIIVRSERQL